MSNLVRRRAAAIVTVMLALSGAPTSGADWRDWRRLVDRSAVVAEATVTAVLWVKTADALSKDVVFSASGQSYTVNTDPQSFILGRVVRARVDRVYKGASVVVGDVMDVYVEGVPSGEHYPYPRFLVDRRYLFVASPLASMPVPSLMDTAGRPGPTQGERLAGALVGAEQRAGKADVVFDPVNHLGLDANSLLNVFREDELTTDVRAAIEEATTVAADQTPPTVSVRVPSAASGVVTLTAEAADDNGVASVQFTVDENPVGPVLTTGPYQQAWDSTTISEGAHMISAVARDNAGFKAVASPHAIRVDHTLPALLVSVSPSVLWPPNGKLVRVTAAVSASDDQPGTPVRRLISIVCDDQCGNEDIVGAVYGTPDTQFELRARRSGAQARRYTIVYEAVDLAGNVVRASTAVVVPHSAPK